MTSLTETDTEITIPEISIAEYAIGYDWLNFMVGAYTEKPAVDLRRFYSTSKEMEVDHSQWWIYWLGKKKRSSNGNTPLHEAVGSEDLSRFLSLDVGCYTDVKNNVGATPLHVAAQNGNIDVVRMLLGAGADKDVREGKYGWTPLHCAIKIRNLDIVKMLLDAGADTEVKENRYGMTPLHLAAWVTYHWDGLVKLLLDAGADKEVKEKWGKTPLHLAAWYGRTGVVKLLLDAGADKDVRDKNGDTPLRLAEKRRNTKIVELL